MRDVPAFGALEMDPAAFDLGRLVAVEVAAGTAVYFDAFLVHRSAPNRSGDDRRALLYSYQPAGYPHTHDLEQGVS
jgi:ectoine hydroxylase-related dioxygenase (phytanoyl-CoA dioxygenase family)